MTGTLKIKANDETLNLLKGAINKFQYSKIMSTMDMKLMLRSTACCLGMR